MKAICKRTPAVVNPVLKNSYESRISLNEGWGFRLDPDEIGMKDRWFEDAYIMDASIKVPGCWQGQGFGNDDEDEIWDFRLKERTLRATYKGTGWYGKRFRLPNELPGMKIWLNFGGVHPSCEVWLNGIKIGDHHAPFVPFAFDITSVVRFNADNELVVRVCEESRFLGFAFNWQGNWSGLYRGVEITATGSNYIDKFWIYPDAKMEKMVFKVQIEGVKPAVNALRLFADIGAINGNLTVSSAQIDISTDQIEFEMQVSAPMLWSPDTPNLYRVDARLEDNEGNILDALSQRTGFAKLSSRGQLFLINDEPFYMRGSGDFISCPETGCPDTDREQWRRKLSVLRDYGYNYVRCQTFVPTPEYLDIADEVGMLVQSEMGMLGPWGGLSIQNLFQWPNPTPEYREILKWQWDQVVMRDVNHPSANIYCMSNEWGNWNHKIIYPRITWQCYHDTKAIKPTAFIIWTDGGNNDSMPGDFINAVAAKDDKCLKSTRPFIQHEFRWWSSFPDVRIMHKYKGAVRPYGAEIAKRAAAKHGVEHLLEVFAHNSQRLQFLEAKGQMEACRRDYPNLAGINHFNANDINPSPQGMLDEFYDKKYADGATWLETNGDTVILASLGFHDRVLVSGDKFSCAFSVSDFSHPPLEKPILEWSIESGSMIMGKGVILYSHTPFCTCTAGSLEMILPDITKPVPLKLKAVLKEKGRKFSNNWDLWLFPNKQNIPEKTALYGNPKYTWLKGLDSIKHIFPDECYQIEENANTVILTESLNEELIEFVKRGGRLVLAAAEGLVRPHTNSLNYLEGRYFFTPPANWWPYEEGQNGTVINSHQMLGDMPHEGFADLQFYRMIAESPPLDMEPLGLTACEPVIRVIHRYMVCRQLAHLTEFSYGKGGVIICSLELDQSWPEARYLFAEICRYAAGSSFKPGMMLLEESMRRIRSGASIP